MTSPRDKELIQKLLDIADLRVNGERPFDFRVHNPDFYPRVLAGGSLALGESYMDGWWDCPAPDGLFLLHTIGGNRSVRTVDPWFEKYIFPNSMLPSARQIAAAAEGLFVMEDWHGFGPHYDPTLMAWHRNFNDNWHRLAERYDRRFFRMWNYYLLSSAGSFRARRNHLWQIVFAKKARLEPYPSIR